MSAETPNPWEQQPGEPAPAFRAFAAFRDLGPARSVVEAYRQTRRKPDATQADGTWNGWVNRFTWSSRAQARDRNLEADRLREAERQNLPRAQKWEKRRDAQ